MGVNFGPKPSGGGYAREYYPSGPWIGGRKPPGYDTPTFEPTNSKKIKNPNFLILTPIITKS